MQIEMGRIYQFNPTAKTDVKGVSLIAGRVKLLRELSPAEIDREEVGRMFQVEQQDGVEVDAFIDELEYIPKEE